MIRHGFVIVLILAASTAADMHEQAQPTPADRFEVSDVMIPTRDGTRLHTKIFLPRSQQGPLPIIIKRTPYGIEGSANNFAAYFKAMADDGYIFVFQDIRGKFGSEGQFMMQRPARETKAGAAYVTDPKSIVRGHRYLRLHRVAHQER